MSIFGVNNRKVHKASAPNLLAAEAEDHRNKILEHNAWVNNLRQGANLYNEAMGDRTPIADFFSSGSKTDPAAGMTDLGSSTATQNMASAAPPPAPSTGTGAASAGSGLAGFGPQAAVTAFMINEDAASRDPRYRNSGPAGYLTGEYAYEDLAERLPNAFGADGGGWKEVTGNDTTGGIMEFATNSWNPYYWAESLRKLV